MSMPLKPINFIIENLLSEGLHILAGSPKVGKSWLALWLSVAIAKGQEVWGGNKVKEGTVSIYVLKIVKLEFKIGSLTLQMKLVIR